jgi:peptide/nickel transport system substrate-binding protein
VKQCGIRIAAASLMLLVLVLAACGTSGTSRPQSGPDGPSDQAEERLRIIYWQPATTLNPHLATGTKDQDAASVILEPLARRDQNDELVPLLAAEIPTPANGGVASDGSSITWTLKPELQWSDGSPVTAADVVFTWRYCADEQTACTTKTNFDPIATIEVVDERTFTIVWKETRSDPYIAFVGPFGMILQQAQFGSCIGAVASTDEACQAANLAPIGTNAWQLKEFRPGDVIVYERNPFYRDAAQVAFDEIEIKGGGDATSAARAVCETGEFDYAWNMQISKGVLEPILAAAGCEPVAGGSYGVERLVLNFADPDPALGALRSEPDQPHPFFSDQRVRQAVALAIDRQAIVDQLYGPTGVATCNILVVPAQFNSPNTSCERDVAAANRLLDEAGYGFDGEVRAKDGVQLRLVFQTNVNPLRQSTQAIIKANLEEIGFAVELKEIDSSIFFSGDPGNPDTLNKFFADLQMYTFGPDSPDPQSYFVGWTCAEAAAATNSWNGVNDSRYCNPAYDAVFADFLAELDPERRAELAIELNDILINDVAVIPLISRRTPHVRSLDLQGPTYNTFDSALWNIADWRRVP